MRQYIHTIELQTRGADEPKQVTFRVIGSSPEELGQKMRLVREILAGPHTERITLIGPVLKEPTKVLQPDKKPARYYKYHRLLEATEDLPKNALLTQKEFSKWLLSPKRKRNYFTRTALVRVPNNTLYISFGVRFSTRFNDNDD